MLFFSLRFLVFFAIVFTLYWALPRERQRVWLLLVASFWFYATWNRWLAVVIAAGATADWAIARAIEASTSARRRKALLLLSIAGNLGQLCYFKYLDFLLASFGELLNAAGLAASMPTFRIVLPIGVSFYTFEAISYTVDVYRGTIRAERSLPAFLLFITFFPRLIAGPIIRGRNFLPQVRRRKRWDWARLQLGVALFLLGLAKKLALADRLALYADPVFATPSAYGSAAVWTATFAYVLQLYCDFSGYSDMAIGLGHMLGYKLPVNFDMPYLSASISEFWRRWHITLSRWFRDYVFVPLGAGRRGAWRTTVNLLVTMALVGLWHGAAWHFIVFGLVHGVVLAVERRGDRRRSPFAPGPTPPVAPEAAPPATWVLHALRVARTFVLFDATCVLFRAPSFATAGAMYARMLVPHGGLGLPLAAEGFWLAAVTIAVAHAGAVSGVWRRATERIPTPALGAAQAALAIVALALAPATNRAFIYFQF